MDVLAAVRVFLRVAELQGFSAAARDLGLAQATVSKAVAQLEAHLGARLLHRTTQSVSLTPDGERAVALGGRLIDDATAFEESFGAAGAPGGLIRIAAPAAFARLAIVPQLKPLLAAHPALVVELTLADAVTDLVEKGVDLAIRIGEPQASDLIARRLGYTRRAAFAAPSYLADRPRPTHPEELIAHDCILHTRLTGGAAWVFTKNGERLVAPIRARVRVDSAEAVREAVLQGLGVAVCPTWLLREELACGRVEPLLAGFEPPALPIHAVWPSRRHTSPKVRAVVEHLARAFAADPELRDPA